MWLLLYTKIYLEFSYFTTKFLLVIYFPEISLQRKVAASIAPITVPRNAEMIFFISLRFLLSLN